VSTISVDYDVLNQKGSPAWFSDTFANIPTAGYIGRMFISIDTYAFYRDTGTGWDLIGGPGIGTLTGSGATGQVSFFNGTQVLTGNNNLFWDNTNSRLGINTTTPGVALDIHATGTNAQFNGTGTSNAYLAFQNAGTSKWRIGNTYNAGANSFDIYNVGLTTTILSISSTTNTMTLSTNVTTTGSQSVQNGLYLSNANAGAQAFYTNMWARNEGVNFALRNLTGGAGFIFQSAASYDYTFPASAGTLALTSNLSAYLPLAGGTLTGALTGTSATFSSSLIAQSLAISNGYYLIGRNAANTAYRTLVTFDSSNKILIGQDSDITAITLGVNSEAMRITSGAGVCIGTTTDGGYKLKIASAGNGIYMAAGSSSGDFALVVNNGVESVTFFKLRGDGLILTGDASQSPYNYSTTGRSAVIQSNGALGYLVSTRESKGNIKSIKSVDFINQLNPVQFNYRKKDDINSTFTNELYDNITYGFIADEVEKVNKELAFYNADGSLAGVEYNSMIAILTKAIQELNEKLVRNNIN